MYKEQGTSGESYIPTLFIIQSEQPRFFYRTLSYITAFHKAFKEMPLYHRQYASPATSRWLWLPPMLRLLLYILKYASVWHKIPAIK